MDTEDLPVCTHVSEGEEDEQLLENLNALDPCGEFDDDAFPKRVQDFLKQYERKVSGSDNRPEDPKATLLTLLKIREGRVRLKMSMPRRRSFSRNIPGWLEEVC